jgi:hypothetical protein
MNSSNPGGPFGTWRVSISWSVTVQCSPSVSSVSASVVATDNSDSGSPTSSLVVPCMRTGRESSKTASPHSAKLTVTCVAGSTQTIPDSERYSELVRSDVSPDGRRSALKRSRGSRRSMLNFDEASPLPRVFVRQRRVTRVTILVTRAISWLSDCKRSLLIYEFAELFIEKIG